MDYEVSKKQEKMIRTLTIALPTLRKELGISQTVLAQKIGISRQMVSYIERQIKPMTWTQFLAIVFFSNQIMILKEVKMPLQKNTRISLNSCFYLNMI